MYKSIILTCFCCGCEIQSFTLTRRT